MNRGVLQTSPPLQMAGNPNWWNINNMKPPTHQQTSPFLNPPSFFPQYYIPSSSASSPSSSSSASSSSSSSSCSSSSTSSSLALPSWHDNQDQLPESWSQLLMGGLVDEGDKGNMRHFQAKKTENWEEQILHHQASTTCTVVGVKRENSATSYVYGHANEDFQAAKPSWSQMIPPASSSPMSSVTNFSSNMLDFSTHKGDARHPPSDLSSECNSTATGGALKKARVQQPSSTQSTFKVRKEKLGDRITSLHQLVSPFGKTDTASVLLEAIGYIRFLQSQIEALSSPYLGSGSSNMKQQQQLQSVQGERNCIFPEEPGQNYNEEPKKDLRSRGLCLVPVSCTLQVGSDNGADYWAPAIGGGFQ